MTSEANLVRVKFGFLFFSVLREDPAVVGQGILVGRAAVGTEGTRGRVYTSG